jgi:signal transduction histidine kinase
MEIDQLKLNMSNVNLFSLVKSVYEPIMLLAAAKGLETSCVMHRDVPEFISTDEIRLKQVITNLLRFSIILLLFNF